MQFANESMAIVAGDPPHRSNDVIVYDTIAAYENIYVNNSSQNGDRAVGEVPLYLSCHDA